MVSSKLRMLFGMGTVCGVAAMLVLVTGCPFIPGPTPCTEDADCDDGDVCTLDLCDVETEECTNTPIEGCCAEDADCAEGEICIVATNTCTELCETAEDCPDDGDPCTVVTCTEGVCLTTAVPDCCNTDADCDEGFECIDNECVEIVVDLCEGVTCDISDLCNPEVCDPATGECVPTPVVCPSDDDMCTTDECDPDTGDCVYLPVICLEGEECDPATGECVTLPVPCAADADCDDGLFCNGAETCVDEVCEAGTDPCAEGEMCDEENDACVACLADEDCEEGETCVGGMCFGPCTEDADCDDEDLCTNDACVDALCVFTSVDCDDADLCTDDSCDPETGDCVNAPVECAEGEICDAATGLCIAACTADADCDDGDACTTDTCDVDTGVCSNTPIGCPAGEECVNGECVEIECTADDDCDDGISCTVDTCEVSTNTCVFAPIDARCDDGQFCTGTGTCDPDHDDADAATGCVMTGDPCVNPTPVCNEATNGCDGCEADADCDDGYSCTIDDCDTLTGVCSWTTSDANCPDPLFCDGPDICNPADPDADPDTGCLPTGDPCAPKPCDEAIDECFNCESNLDCDDGILCTEDACDGITGDCTHTPADVLCPDPLFCDGVDVCVPADPYADASGCIPPYSYPCAPQACDEAGEVCLDCESNADCDDGIDCTDDFCFGAAGTCTNTDNCFPLVCNPYTGECE